jgi:diaminobutyrate-2-oxoglutarate transaminase
VTLAKSLSGMGLPFALTLFRPELDIWSPGEHNGTFRGNNHAFVTATAALRHFWQNDAFMSEVRTRGEFLKTRLDRIAAQHGLKTRGRGMMRGIDCRSGEVADEVTARCFERGLIIETSGAHDEVVKVLAPLTISEEELSMGLDILETSLRDVLAPSFNVAAE